jgi:AraC-like DNA-binding protein
MPIAPELSLTAVALQQRVSPRYIHMLFESEGTTFSEYVLSQRLMPAHGMPTDPCFTSSMITTVAHNARFSDLSYFDRIPPAVRRNPYRGAHTLRRPKE